MKKPELLAPAGDMSCLRAAVAAGADAVYLGGQRFGARAFAGNFSGEELLEALKLAHFFDKKIYLTVNTLTKDSELEELIPWLTPFYEAGLDGLIIQDLGVLERCRKAFPQMPLHASTQMTVTEARTALFLKGMGVSRIVPARELSLEEIILLGQETGMELETFIHGALCYSYSGQCLFSSLLGGRSGNRGRCAQPCRLPYQIMSPNAAGNKRGKTAEQYPLSLKDLCVLPFLPKLMDAGIDSFKIEGRMKSPEYVAGVTGMYRKYIDLYEKDPENWQVDRADMERLSRLYVRSELSGGYYDRHNGREMVTLQKPGYAGASGAILEEIRAKYLTDGLTKTVDLAITLRENMPAKLTALCGGACAAREGMTVMPAQKKPLTKADVEKQLRRTGGSHFTVGKLDVLLEGNVFLPVSALNDLRRQTLDALYDALTARAKRAGRPEGSGGCGGTQEQTAPCGDSETLRKQAETAPHKTGNAGALRECETAVPHKAGVFCEQEETAPHKTGNAGALPDRRPLLYVSALNAGQALAAASEEKVARVYLSSDAVFDSGNTEPLLDAVRARKAAGDGFSLFLTLPVILRAYSDGYLKRLMAWLEQGDHGALTDGLQAGSLSGILWARESGWNKAISLNHSAYVFNAETLSVFLKHFQVDSYTAPLELNRSELKRLPAEKMEMTVYGRLPMMQSAGCIRRTAGECRISHTMETLSKGMPQRSMQYFLKDRYQTEFPVLINCNHCMNTVYNSVPLSLHQYLSEISGMKAAAVRLDFTDESPEETKKVIRFFSCGEEMAMPAYTTGHYKKGVQ